MAKKNKSKVSSSPKPLTIRRTLQKAESAALIHADLEDVTPIVQFLENFQLLADPRNQSPSKLISIKIPEPLLAAFRFKATRMNIPYQTMIKRLMEQWLKEF